ncbi:hypothetical protein LRP49_11830 [Enterovibrio sp. ZSDZ35]|uniref:Lipoprotein n=1 Tax=Enterovibrio qingdaonensis TaxID=2899818 RepID=A0ABT5QLW6_9GAMM|nr:hypothetical protein [Enterovibrio sp. ZSDZ35]MDD1781864.1 hypothetical protein [Enterovibrio sp. ZSDZ35]
MKKYLVLLLVALSGCAKLQDPSGNAVELETNAPESVVIIEADIDRSAHHPGIYAYQEATTPPTEPIFFSSGLNTLPVKLVLKPGTYRITVACAANLDLHSYFDLVRTFKAGERKTVICKSTAGGALAQPYARMVDTSSLGEDTQ